MEFNTVIANRRSVREYKDKKISDRLTRRIINAGCKAPSLHNLQPWRFIVLGKKSKKRLADVMRKRALKEFVFLNSLLRGNALIVENAPLAIAVYNTGPLSKRFKRLGRFYEDCSITWEAQSIACCIENMLLEATSLRLGSAFIGCALLCKKDICGIFKIDGELMAVLTFGYPKSMTKILKRKKFKEVAQFL